MDIPQQIEEVMQPQAAEQVPQQVPQQTLSQDSGVLTPGPAPTPQATPFDPAREWIPEEYRGESCLKNYTNIPDLVKGFVSAQKQIGYDKMTVPNEHSTQEQWLAAHRKLGLPSDLTQYQLEVPPDANFNDGFVTELKEQMFKANILPQQGNQLLKWYAEANDRALAEQNQQYEADVERGISELKQEWGNAFQQRVSQAKSVLDKFGDEQVFDWIAKENLADDKNLIKLLSKIGQNMFKEDSIVGKGQSSVMTPDSAKSEWQKIQGDRQHAYWDRQNPNHHKALDDVKHLFEQMNPEG